MTQELSKFTRFANRYRLISVLSVLAVLVFLGQSIIYAHTSDVTMDEGTYLTKGLLFVNGVYRPFQDYGPWTNKMPFSFFIPGVFQVLFEPGLRTGRYSSIFLSLISLLGLYITARRLGGKGWAAVILWAVAINPANIATYSQAISQVVIAALMCWVFALTLGNPRPLWQITLGAVLASLVVLTRQNMVPILPLLIFYIFWEHGRRPGWTALIAAASVFLFFHILYWPNILLLWDFLLPGPLEHLLDPIKLSAGDTSVLLNTQYSLLSKWFVFWEGIRYNFLPIMGTLAVWILWPRRNKWSNESSYKTAVFLSVLFSVLWLLHFLGAYIKSYCLFCYTGYLAFFTFSGFLLCAVAWKSLDRSPGFLRQVLLLVVVVVFSLGIASGAYQSLDQLVMNIPVPRVRNLQILPGSTELWRALSNKFGWSFENLQQVLPALAGLAAGIFFLILAALIFLAAHRRARLIRPALIAFLLFITTGALLSPSSIFGGGKQSTYCGWDVIASHETVGAQLKKSIPPGSQVYWENDISPLPLLYLLPAVRIYPAQLNHWYSYRVGGDPDVLLKTGMWNEELATRWKAEADYLLIAERYVLEWQQENVAEQYEELTPASLAIPCRQRSIIHIFKRIP
jgi:hypothetical protein